jgi:predicted  nucleic acid-binding Zn-ribbon protein
MRKQLSQQKLLEILTHEIDMLRETSKNINEIAPAIARQLHELKTTKLKFDLNTERLEWLLANYEKKLKKSVVIPRWFFWLVAGVLLLSIANWLVWFNSGMV